MSNLGDVLSKPVYLNVSQTGVWGLRPQPPVPMRVWGRSPQPLGNFGKFLEKTCFNPIAGAYLGGLLCHGPPFVSPGLQNYIEK